MKFIPSPEVFEYINSQLNEDIQKLALKKNPFPEMDWKWILNQIAAKKKAKDKLPTWYKTNAIIYPSTLSIEQTSSELLAAHKSQLINGKKVIDLTGGFGIDAYYFAKSFKEVTHCEWNEELSNIVQYNSEKLGVKNITFFQGNSIEYLQNTSDVYDLIYIDPARRDEHTNKVFRFEDCEPNVVEYLDLLLEKSTQLLIKSSPLVDIHLGIQQLKFVSKIWVVAYKNEVKELLWLVSKNCNLNPTIEAVNIEKDNTYSFENILVEDDVVQFSHPKTYLYEPFSSLLKTGLFNAIGNTYHLAKLHPHSHLYTSDEKIDFPGRVFDIVNIYPFQKAEIKKYIQNQKMNVTIRNFPLSVDQLRKKYKIKEGGDIYAFFTTNIEHEKIIIITKKIEKF